MSEPGPLSASIIGSFAYLTVKDRLPVIVTRVIDQLYRERINIVDKYGEAATEGCKEVIGRLSQLKNAIQTNKPLELLEATDPLSPCDDSHVWNRHFEEYISTYEVPPKWFTAPWMYVECFMYAHIHESFYLCPALKDFDPFCEQKQKALLESLSATETLAQHVLSVCSSLPSLTQEQLRQHVINLIEISVWGNKCDLSISSGEERSPETDLLVSLDSLRPYILVNHSSPLWQLLVSLPEDQRDIVLVLDNAGFELVTDLCLMMLLTEAGLTTSLTFHVKTRPWFVSDTTHADLFWTLDTLREKGGACSEIGNKWKKYIEDGQWKVCESSFWTTPIPYSQMSTVDPNLYSQLSKASLIIFKGDLNYRKLTGDLDWPTTTNFEQALRGFCVAPLLVLRTLKGGPVVGMAERQAEDLATTVRDWNTSGEYGVIQLCTFS
ncbi:hypothetical protein Pcinc_023007 [Petrolisthes cinctipes]|uniref:Sugar phosphate phosphatase n=1 Tax=Petrolisthes cinctipes TaxID=88211 RepID=A0AAE1FBU5_PETCI|nr:hypothetical protein Pcinc_023680 [Petrolisthes cinctipes]KAK3871873.1 hypothetical protein Pcinc_023007 [Petrolisthes cinctipes]